MAKNAFVGRPGQGRRACVFRRKIVAFPDNHDHNRIDECGNPRELRRLYKDHINGNWRGKRMQRFYPIMVLLVLVAGYTRNNADSAEKPQQPIVLNAPVEFQMTQRSTIALPGSDDRILITIDDITRGQVMTSVSWQDGNAIVATRSLRQNDSVIFTVDSCAYKIQLIELKNRLVGDDTARFELSSVSGESEQTLAESEKIEKLISSLREMNGAKFIRNAQEHTVDEAITHLTGKWETMKIQIKTAQDFIAIVASRSSTTGKPYLLKLADGTIMRSQEWFRKQLKIIEKLPNKELKQYQAEALAVKRGERLIWARKRTPVSLLTNVTQLATGWSHSLALKSDGSIVGLGDNRWGMADPPDGNDYVAVAAGTYFSLALKRDGSIVGWGDGASGAKYPPDGNDFVAISAGSNHALALKQDGSIVSWGDNDWGQVRSPPGNDFVAVAAGFYHSLAVKSDGSIIGWGSNLDGEATPPAGNNFIAIAAGGGHSLALRSDGSIVGWGSNFRGQAKPPDAKDFVAIAAGREHSLALKSDGSIVGWGDNGRGQARPPAGNDFVAIAAGFVHSLALKSDGSIVGWGKKYAMEQPILPRPKVKEKAKKEVKQEVTEPVKIENASSLKSIGPLPNTIRLMVDEKINIDLIYIKPGSFIMGRDVGWGEKFISKINDLGMVGKYPDDWPAREVKITKGFYIGKYKVTSAQFCRFLNTIENPQDYVKLNIFARIERKGAGYVPKAGCENCPINVVHWKGAVAFCNWLSHPTGLAIRLPTEAEWEFAARGREGRSYPWGEEENVEWAADKSRDYKTYPHPWSCAPVDAFPENVTPDGVVGMAGGVGEWCSDFYGVRYLKKDVIDPQGPTQQDLSDKSINPFDDKYHVLREGKSATSRSFGDEVDESAGIYGFRVLMELDESESEERKLGLTN